MSLRSGLLAAVWFCFPAAAPAADPPAVLHLTDGGHLPGTLVGSDAPEVWRWRSPVFARPVEFPAAAVRGVHYAMPAAPPKPTGEFCFELAGEDVVYGDLAALTDTEVELTGTAVGRLRLKREYVRRLYRWKGNDTVYAGPNGLTGWTAAPAGPAAWREEGGHLVTDRPGAALFADLGLPDRAVVEVGLSWKGPPDFVLALGADDRDGAVRQGFRFEVWDGQLVVVGESPRDADVAVVQPAAANGSVRVQVVLDQTQRRLTLLSRAGKPLATLTLDPARAEPRRGVRLVNGNGDLRVEHLRVARWAGPPPRDIRDDQPRVGRTDGSVVYGRVTGYDPAAKQFTVREGDRETAVPADAVGDVYLVAPTASPPADAGGDGRSLRVALRDGTRVSGRPATVADTHLTLACPGIQEPLRLPLADVRSLIPLRPAVAAGPPPEGRPGRLDADGVRLPGRLVGDGTRLLWHPDLGRTAGELAPGFAGRIVYRDPPPVVPSPVLQNRRRVLLDGEMVEMGVVQGRLIKVPAAPAPVAGGGRKSLHLRTGDAIPCEVVRIDERGVTLKSPQTEVTLVPHEKVKSVELVPTRDAPALDEAKRDRLLMLPRSQKDTPPTHLICAKTGDFLRGRLVAMDDAKLIVEVRLETKEIPRDRVAQIIWLHPDELAAAPAARTVAGPAITRAQTVAAGGNRLTFAAAGSDGRTISGTSDVLGGRRVALADVDQVLFGDAIERAAAELAYHRWRLRHAPEPKFVTADGGSAGADSPLVGQPAPPLRLPLLDGKPYDLADRKGKVVVLEFWATWCGPCLQTMPLVEAVTREFADKGVELLAVNLEEPQDKVKATLDRQKLAVPVALDRDGVAAGRYAVTSIPQVVVIDRDGKVARLFIGGGKETADGLRSALQALLDK